ncbi:MAG: 50S ribosomal protein L21 [Verrucomicrobia bacterium]|nr:50S ribosomal protein L21 [Verrucomicrobiota bacterium]
MFAVIQTGGRQHAVKEGDIIQIQRLPGDEGKSVKFDEVLYIGGTEEPQIGSPTVAKARVEGEVMRHDKARKVHGMKFKRRKGYRRHVGHRQPITVVKITKIEVGA